MPNNLDFHLLLIDADSFNKQYDLAINICEKVMQLDPKNISNYKKAIKTIKNKQINKEWYQFWK